MKTKVIIMGISGIAAILFWTALIIYGNNVGFYTKLYDTQLLIAILLITVAYAATITFSVFLGLFIYDKLYYID